MAKSKYLTQIWWDVIDDVHNSWSVKYHRKGLEGWVPCGSGVGSGHFWTGWLEIDAEVDGLDLSGAALTNWGKTEVRQKGTVSRGSITGQGSIRGLGTYDIGDNCSLSFDPADGWKLSSWDRSGSSSSDTFEVKDDYSINAVFVPNEFKLTLGNYITAKNGPADITSGSKVTYNTSVKLIATVRTGWTFDHFELKKNDGTKWGNDIADGGTFNMPDMELTATAIYIHNLYDITCSVEAETAGTLTASAETAYYNDEITLETTANEGYYFAYYESDPVVSIVDNKFNMPPSDIEVTAVFYRRSTATLDKSAYTGGDTAVMTIDAENEAFTHKYILDFGFGMVSNETDVAAGVSTVNIYIPVAWSRMMASTPKTGGKLTLKTYAGDGTYVGSYEITGLSYAALNGTIPKLTVFRAKENGAYIRNGLRAGYHAAYPSSTSAKLICGNDKQNNPAASGLIMPGNKKKFALEETQIVELEITYGSETFKLTESVPAVRLVQKKVDVTVVSSS